MISFLQKNVKMQKKIVDPTVNFLNLYIFTLPSYTVLSEPDRTGLVWYGVVRNRVMVYSEKWTSYTVLSEPDRTGLVWYGVVYDIVRHVFARQQRAHRSGIAAFGEAEPQQTV